MLLRKAEFLMMKGVLHYGLSLLNVAGKAGGHS